MKKRFDRHHINKLIVYGSLYAMTLGIIFSVFLIRPHEAKDFPLLRKFIILFSSVLLTKYFLYMIISPWHDVITAYYEKRYRRKIKSYNPLVSVMIPAWNESFGVLNTIKTILESNYRNIQIVVINDGSTDNSHALIDSFVRDYYANPNEIKDIEITYHYKENGGKGRALNTAYELSKGDILISIDADCILLEDTIGNFVRAFANPRVMAAVGNVKVGNTKHIIGVIQYLEFLFSFYFKKAESVMNSVYIIGGAAGAFRRRVFEKIGVYNPDNITEDIELSVRIQDAGMKIVYVSDAIVYTEGASDIPGLKKQRLRWKRGRFETFFKHPQLFFSTDKKHSKILSWVILPLAYFGEVQLGLELFFISFLYVYSYLIADFSSFISGIIVVGSMFFIQMFFDDKETRSASFYILAPIGWLLFYVATYVEWDALIKSISGIMKKQELKWQKWERKGVGR